jgi:hypothetical protein
MLETCGSCGTKYAPDLTRCPNCGTHTGSGNLPEPTEAAQPIVADDAAELEFQRLNPQAAPPSSGHAPDPPTTPTLSHGI